MVDNSHYKTSLHAAREIYQMEGIRWLYSGYCSCILTDWREQRLPGALL